MQLVDELMQRYVADQKSAGMLTLVSQKGKIIHLNSCGFRDIESSSPMQADTLFRIYSMTKAITSVALMTLFEKGEFQLDDPAYRWIPELKTLKVFQEGGVYTELESHITIRQLLTHTAGFSYGFYPENNPVDKLYAEVWRELKKDRPLHEIMALAFELPLLAQPGTRWQYSIATDICGYLVQIMTDMSFGDYLQKTILDPLDMADTGFEVPAAKRQRFSSMYGLSDEQPLALLESNRDSAFIPSTGNGKVNFQSGGGGLISSIEDYWQFAQMMLNRGELNGVRILQPETVDDMTRNHVADKLQPLAFNGLFPEPVNGYGFGLGYCISLEDSDIGNAGDFGWSGMADTYFWIDPKEQLVGILMQQFMPSLTHSGRLDFRKAVYSTIQA
jgi:CubicO group peptidase (beta-lactamase class C family)